MKKRKLGIIAGLTTMCSKVFGMSITPVLYGPPRQSILEIGLKAFQTIIAPILFLVGIIMYLKKSKSSKKRKIITTTIFILLFVGIYYGIECFFDYMCWY